MASTDTTAMLPDLPAAVASTGALKPNRAHVRVPLHPGSALYSAEQMRNYAQDAIAALAGQADADNPAIAPAGDAVAAFRVWWGTNAPPGTVISDPNWWADRILRRLAIVAAPQDGEADQPVGDVVPTLRAMVHNYRHGHDWDHLDDAACTKAADLIVALRQQLAATIAERDELRRQHVVQMQVKHDAWQAAIDQRDNATLQAEQAIAERDRAVKDARWFLDLIDEHAGRTEYSLRAQHSMADIEKRCVAIAAAAGDAGGNHVA